MQNWTYSIGVMSGTSVDGIDLVYIRFDTKNYENFEILASNVVSYSEQSQFDLKNAISFPKEQLNALHISFGKLLANAINNFITENKITKLDFIASHGHTVFHQPENGITLQIGDGQTIANETNHNVICDFRTQDVQLGGQGAPLVPIGDELLFSTYEYCINLGGFANISYNKEGKRIAYDICPVNIVMNVYAQKLGFPYDDKGDLAKKGTICQPLLDELNALEFYQKQAPKSLGLEWVQEYVFPKLKKYELSEYDILRTFLEHCALQIGGIIKDGKSVLITGGGAYNTFLIQRIEAVSNVKIALPKNELIEFKEALIFAFLGLLRSKNEVNCLQSVTGASKDHSSGFQFFPKK